MKNSEQKDECLTSSGNIANAMLQAVPFSHIGLFEGIGGFSLAAKQMGWVTKAWCEINPFCQKVLRYHFPEAEGFGDITKSDFTKYANAIDILTGGFPCQPFSTSGKRKGTEDERYLWEAMLAAIRSIQPRWVVAENVHGLINWNGGLVFNQVQADLEAEGYEVQPVVLPACGINAPHKRNRVWFIAHSCSINSTLSIQQWRQDKTSNTYADRTLPQGIVTNSNAFGQRLKKEKNRQRTVDGNTWDQFPTQSPICSGDDGLPTQLDGITFSKWRESSIEGFGNAIVPQLALQIFRVIEEMEERLSLKVRGQKINTNGSAVQ